MCRDWSRSHTLVSNKFVPSPPPWGWEAQPTIQSRPKPILHIFCLKPRRREPVQWRFLTPERARHERRRVVECGMNLVSGWCINTMFVLQRMPKFGNTHINTSRLTGPKNKHIWKHPIWISRVNPFIANIFSRFLFLTHNVKCGMMWWIYKADDVVWSNYCFCPWYKDSWWKPSQTQWFIMSIHHNSPHVITCLHSHPILPADSPRPPYRRPIGGWPRRGLSPCGTLIPKASLRIEEPLWQSALFFEVPNDSWRTSKNHMYITYICIYTYNYVHKAASCIKNKQHPKYLDQAPSIRNVSKFFWGVREK